MKKFSDKINAQTVTELAVFGAIIIFIIGTIVRQSLGFSYSQNQNLKAMRMAMSQSFKYSQGLKGPDPENGDASRNNASVLIIEDRLTSDSAKYGALDRIPQIAQGSATHSCNLFLPVESCEHYNMPVLDLYINGVYVALSTARMVAVSLVGAPTWNANEWDPNCNCRLLYEKIPNGLDDFKQFPAGQEERIRFNLDRDPNGTIDVPKNLQPDFAWQWQQVQALDGNIQQGELFDVDGDQKEEQILQTTTAGNIVNSVLVRDDQEGDLDFTLTSFDTDCTANPNCIKEPPGLTNNTMLLAYTKHPTDRNAPGTYLRIEEGKLIDPNNQVVRSTQRKDTVDIISREIILARDNTIFCRAGFPINYGTATQQEKELSGYFRGMSQNPVEACGNCFSEENIYKTCFQSGVGAPPRWQKAPRLYIRSRIQDRRGRKWITNIMGDKTVEFQKATQ